jgi:hypothetical protein
MLPESVGRGTDGYSATLIFRIGSVASRRRYDRNRVHAFDIMLAFEHFHLCASRGKFAAKRSDEWNDRLAVLLVFGFVGNGGLNNKIC